MSKSATLTLKPSEAIIAVEAMIKVNLAVAKMDQDRRGLFMWGPPGVAKSSIVKQIAKKLNMKVVDVRLTQMDPTDLRGIPVPSGLGTDSPEVHWAIPAMLPKRDAGKRTATIVDPLTGHVYDGAIILLDELPNAAPSVQAGSYQLVLDGELGEYYVPDNVVVMAAGNRETDKGSTFKMPTPLMNRFVHIEVRPDFNDWQDFALMSGFHKDVIGYLTAFKAQLHNFDPMSASRGFATGRSWHFVSDILLNAGNMPDNVLHALVAGAVGDGIAVQFLDYCKNAARLPSASDILDGRVTTMEVKDTSLCYSLATSLAYELKDRFIKMQETKTKESKEKFDTYCNNLLKFMMKEFKPEMTVMAARTCMSKFHIKFNPPGIDVWKDFAAKFSNLIIGKS